MKLIKTIIFTEKQSGCLNAVGGKPMDFMDYEKVEAELQRHVDAANENHAFDIWRTDLAGGTVKRMIFEGNINK